MENVDKQLREMLLDDFEFASDQGDMTTTEKYRDNARIFLKGLDLRPATVNKQTMVTIGTALDLRLPQRGEQLRIRTQTELSMLSLVMAILARHGVIDELTIVTYTFNRESYVTLTELLTKGRIGQLNLLLASSYTFRDKRYYDELKRQAAWLSTEAAYHLVFAWSHLKITLARCGADFYQLEGSMNYSRNNQAEQLVFENNRETYEYDYEFIIDVMTDTTHTSLEVIC